MIEISFPTLRHALEDMQKAHKEIFNLIPVQFVTTQHVAARGRHTLVLRRQKTHDIKRVELSGEDGIFVKRRR